MAVTPARAGAEQEVLEQGGVPGELPMLEPHGEADSVTQTRCNRCNIRAASQGRCEGIWGTSHPKVQTEGKSPQGWGTERPLHHQHGLWALRRALLDVSDGTAGWQCSDTALAATARSPSCDPDRP